MALVDIIKSSLDSIRQISEHVEGAILYLDAGCTESFQFHGAFPLLFELGVRAICSLENVSTLDMVIDWNANRDQAGNIVVITSRLLSDAHRYILRCLSTHEDIHSCKIFTSISEIAHSAYPDSPLGPDAFREYESLLVQDYEELVKKSGTKFRRSVEGIFKKHTTLDDEGWSHFGFEKEENPHVQSGLKERDFYEDTPTGHTEYVGTVLVVSVQHFPMILCPLSPRVFVLPSEGSVAEAYISIRHEDSLCSGLPPLSTGLAHDGDDVPGATLTAHFLYHLATKLDLKLEIFSFGNLSKSVGKILTDMSSLYDVSRRKKSAGLLLIDRTLDLLTPCCHGDSLVDRMFSSLPRKERTTSFSHKGSQTQLKVPAILQRASLDLQIPVTSILTEEDPEARNYRLLERIEAFLHGWDSSDSASQIVDLNNLCTKIHGVESLHSEIDLLSGSLIAAESFRGTPYLEALLDRRTKDGTILVKKWLQESMRKENISLNVRTRPGLATKSELQPMIKALAKSQSSLLRNKGIIQLGEATLFALDESCSARWDAFISAEKMLGVSAGDTSQSLAAQIRDIISTSTQIGSQHSNINKSLLSFEDALLLTITGYILAGENFPTSGSTGPFSWQEEHFLKEAVVDAVLRNPVAAKLKFLHGLTEALEANFNNIKTKEESLDQLEDNDFDDDQWGQWGDEDNDDGHNDKEQVYDNMQLKLELRDRVDNFFRFLHKLSSLRSRSVPLKEGALASESDISDDPNMRKCLLYNVLKRVLGKYDICGLEYHSSTVGRLFKSGFGRFGIGQAKPNLGDQNVILVFVIGGINSVEVREAHEALSESGRPDIELIIGGTTLLTPDDMFDLLLGNPCFI